MSTVLVVPSDTTYGSAVTQRHIILNHVPYIVTVRKQFDDRAVNS